MTGSPEALSVCTDSYGNIHRLNGEISRGGQGTVFRTLVPNVVVKFELKDGRLVPPDENEKFMTLRFLPIPSGLHVTMPQATLKDYSGYVMTMMSDMISFRQAFDDPVTPEKRITTPFTEKHDKKHNNFFSDYISSGGERRRLEAFMKSAAILSQLHANGLVYCDYSQNNVFVSVSKDFCHVWLIDADNLDYESRTLKSFCYTPGLAAPEVAVLADEYRQGIPEKDCVGSGNSFGSDVYTFAVCLFTQLAGIHPFKGRKYFEIVNEDDSYDSADDYLCKGMLAYVADSEDDSNRREFLRLDVIMTLELKALFQQTFSQEGRDSYILRPSMSEWAFELARVNDISLHCNSCGMDFINADNDKCPFCGESLPEIFFAESRYVLEAPNAPALWEYSREIQDGGIILPLRLAHGYDADELDRALLSLHIEGDIIILKIDSMSASQKVLFSEDGKNFTAGSTVKTHKRNFCLLCEDDNRGLNVLIQCGVNHGRH